jgi:hypothetical protein
MPSRICTEQPMENLVVGREVREIHERLEAMEAMQRRTPITKYVSDEKREEIEVEEIIGEYVVEECLLKDVLNLGAREKMYVPMYEGNLDVKELLD